MKTGFTALVVDDDDFSRQTAVHILKRLGARAITEAANGKTALRLAADLGDTVDLFLCDLKMPDIDGIETLSGLAACNRSAVFVLASGVDPRLLRAAAQVASLGNLCDLRVVSKPITLAKMDGIVEALAVARTSPVQQPDAPASLSLSAEDVLRGLDAGEFTAFYQPKVDILTHRVCGAEALIRWRNPDHGLLSPNAFLGIAQNEGLLKDFFFLVFSDAIVDCASWRRADQDLGISVNLPLAALTSRDLPNMLEEIVLAKGLLPQHVTFEVTEDGWLQHELLAREVLTRLRIRGFGLAIDDFGTGYSGTQQLLDAPFNEMKIDASFVRRAPDDCDAAIAFASSVALARELNLTVVAEGVETAIQWDLVQKAGCDQVQGYIVSQPLPSDQFTTWLLERSAVGSTLMV